MNVRKLMLVMVAVPALLAGCGVGKSLIDQCMRREIFQQCMAALPAGPKSTMYNDWDEVVDQCDSTARFQSLRRESQISLECQP